MMNEEKCGMGIWFDKQVNEMQNTIGNTLEDRQKTHGDFGTHAYITQQLKSVLNTHQAWNNNLSESQREALEMILHKIGRIMAGNPDFHDHWHDIAGYATLIANQLDDVKT